ncbi:MULTISPECIES: class C sortase [unclassified Leucobacter]|uniref:class C sortase n=1 Tax=unclassified Leucobacter TaxID=2621730 RepID=UPI00165DCC40|nr:MULTISPECIES: class C sortase [unclassified Leucobacter]MBC9926596.1 class C sortase [Leucobacter sp. cx-169]
MSTNATRWRPGALTWLITVIAFVGLVAGLYPMTAAWLSSYNQSQILKRAATNLDDIDPTPADQLGLANQYNIALTAGVKLESGGNVPVGTGNLTDSELRYSDMLQAGPEGLMGRVKIDSIDVDLPIYHGTSEDTLLRGAGHLEGSHLPVGGESTRSVVTAHRGLANSTMFTNLNQVQVGDTFTLEVLGEALVYQVFDVQVIDPSDASSLVVIPGKDTATLITCTPLGINSHRIVVTGERITPTPTDAIASVGNAPEIPGFPWWAVFGVGGILLFAGYVWRRGYVDRAVLSRRGN